MVSIGIRVCCPGKWKLVDSGSSWIESRGLFLYCQSWQAAAMSIGVSCGHFQGERIGWCECQMAGIRESLLPLQISESQNTLRNILHKLSKSSVSPVQKPTWEKRCMSSMLPCHGGETGAMLQVKQILHICSNCQMCFNQDEVINDWNSKQFSCYTGFQSHCLTAHMNEECHCVSAVWNRQHL